MLRPLGMMLALVLTVALPGSLAASPTQAPPGAGGEAEFRALFEEKYQAWRDYIAQPHISFSSRFDPYVNNARFREIVALGLPALPLIAEKMAWHGELQDVFMAYAAGTILKRTNWQEGERIWIWWQTAPQAVPSEFEQALGKWREAQARGDARAARQALEELEGIGVLALPLMVAKVTEGETKLIPLISRLTDGAVKAQATRAQLLAWWAKDKAKWTLPEQKPPAPPSPETGDTAPGAR